MFSTDVGGCCLDVVEVFSLRCNAQVICIDETACFWYLMVLWGNPDVLRGTLGSFMRKKVLQMLEGPSHAWRVLQGVLRFTNELRSLA